MHRDSGRKWLSLLVMLAATGCSSTAGTGAAGPGSDVQGDALAGTDAVVPDASAPDAKAADGTADAGADADAAADVAADVGADAATGPSYAAVQAVFDARCTICHDAQKLGLPADPKLPLTADVSYKTLVNQPASETCGGTLVVPGHPETSYLYQKLTQTPPCSGLPMPHAFEMGPTVPLTAEQLATVKDWIAAGAKP